MSPFSLPAVVDVDVAVGAETDAAGDAVSVGVALEGAVEGLKSETSFSRQLIWISGAHNVTLVAVVPSLVYGITSCVPPSSVPSLSHVAAATVVDVTSRWQVCHSPASEFHSQE